MNMIRKDDFLGKLIFSLIFTTVSSISLLSFSLYRELKNGDARCQEKINMLDSIAQAPELSNQDKTEILRFFLSRYTFVYMKDRFDEAFVNAMTQSFSKPRISTSETHD